MVKAIQENEIFTYALCSVGEGDECRTYRIYRSESIMVHVA